MIQVRDLSSLIGSALGCEVEIKDMFALLNFQLKPEYSTSQNFFGYNGSTGIDVLEVNYEEYCGRL